MSKIVILLLFAICAYGQDVTEKVPPPNPIPITNSTTTTTTTLKPTTNSTTTTTTTTVKPTTNGTTTATTTTVKPTTNGTTTVKPTTPTPKPTPIPPTPKPVGPAINNFTGNYTGTKRICFMMKMAVQIDIGLDKNSTKINVTDDVKYTTSCANDSVELLQINWGNDLLAFTFLKNNSKYEIHSVTANISLPGRNATFVHQKPEFSVSTTQSYKCAKDQSLNLTEINSNVTVATLHISHLQYQAFMNTTTPRYDSAWYCDATNTPDIVPVVVGCVLAALVVLVLAAYLFGRKRWQARGYLSMENDGSS